MKNKSRILCALLAALMALSTSLTMLSCDNDTPVEEETTVDSGNPTDPTQPSDTEQDLSNYEVYYYEADGHEDLLTLFESKRFTLTLASGNKAGTYAMDGEALTLTFSDKETVVNATVRDGIISFTYAGSEKRFLKKTSFTITFDSKGGDAISAVTVENGKQLTKPNDPVYAGYTLIGWYTDEAYTKPFLFGSDVVTGDMTLYARWGQSFVGQNEYTVRFDLGYDAVAPQDKTTIGGIVYDLPTPAARDGYTFAGWWVSTTNARDALSYPYTESIVLQENVTLFALWTAAPANDTLASPVVEVNSTTVKWESVTGATSYELTIAGPDGFDGVQKTIGATSEKIDFSSLPAGDYTVTVTAVAGDKRSAPTVRGYRNKVLPRVSLFTVQENSILLFNRVANATRYLITVECGDPAHQHTLFDNGNSANYNFINCTMQKGGIRFTITAEADGYASSTSEVFVYDRTLDAISDFRYDSKTGILYWNSVAGAAYYTVTVENGADTQTFLSAANSLSLKTYGGSIKVTVAPLANGYNSPDAAEHRIARTELATPADIKLNGMQLAWGAVTGATSYEVKIGSKVYTAQEATLDISTLATWEMNGAYDITIRAIGTQSSLWSDTITALSGVLSTPASYQQGVLTWKPVIGATKYEVSVNDGLSTMITNGATSLAITLEQGGVNTIAVRYTDAKGDFSAWTKVEVVAHTVVLDNRGGVGDSEAYYAVGDVIQLPEPTKSGYAFAGWYNTPAGPETNGALFTDTYFSVSGELILYAYWTPKQYEVILDKDLSNDETVDETETVKQYFGKPVVFPIPTCDDKTVVFGGWYTAKEGAGTRYTDGDGVSLVNWDIAMDGTILYAHWVEVLVYEQMADGTYSVAMGEGISYVTEVTIPSTYNGALVSTVDAYAFKNCSKLIKISIPNTIKNIETGTAFYGCSKLETLEIYEVEGNKDIIYSSQGGILVKHDEGSSKIEAKFVPAGMTGEVVIPDGVQVLPLKLFSSSKVSSVIIPASVVSIEKNAFYSCSQLTSITFLPAKEGETPNNLTLATAAFYSCSKLTEITFPSRLESFDAGVFSSCSKLANIHIEDGNPNLASIDGVIVNAAKDTLIYCPAGREGVYTIPDGITIIGEGAFKNNKQLTEVVIPEFVTEIQKQAFYSLSKLKKVTFTAEDGLGTGVTLGEQAFSWNSYLETVVFESGSKVTEIGKKAFYYCNKLTTFVIPKTVTTVGDSALASCKLLKTVEIEEGGKDVSFGTDVFADCVKLTSFKLPASVTSLDTSMFSGCDSMEEIIVDANNPNYCSVDGVLFNKAQTQLLFYPRVKAGSYTIPDTVTEVGASVFEGNTKLTEITIGNSITSIGEAAFKDCTGLVTVNILPGDTELVLGESVFEGCSAIESIALNRVKELPNRLFYFLSSSTDAQLKTVTLPADLTSIGNYAFYYASRLESITIGTSVTSIGNYAFYRCEAITEITVPGNVKTVGNYAFAYTGATTITMEEGVETLGNNVCSGTAISTFRFPDSVTSIGNAMFSYCKSLSTIENYDGSPVRDSEGNITTYVIGNQFFMNSSITSFTISKNISQVGYNAFSGCESLVSVIFEAGGTADLALGKGVGSTSAQRAFANCTALESIVIPARVTELSSYAFTGCTNLKSITFETGSRLQVIGKYTFQNCKALEQIVIPGTVNNLPFVSGTAQVIGLGDYAFDGCSALKMITFEESTDADAIGLSIGTYAFRNCTVLEVLNLPARLTDYQDKSGSYLSCFQPQKLIGGCEALREINIGAGGKTYASADGMVFSADLKMLYVCPAGKTGTVTIPNTVTEIQDYAFQNGTMTEVVFAPDGNEALTLGDYVFTACDSLVTVTMSDRYVNEDSVKKLLPLTIGTYLFNSCDSLESITFPESLRTLGKNTFSSCKALTSVQFTSHTTPFKDGKDGLTVLEESMFTGCTALEQITIPAQITELKQKVFYNCSKLVSVTFAGNNVTAFGNQVFYGCKALTSFVIPSAVSKLGNGVFYNCSALTSVTLSAKLTSVTLSGSNNVFYGCTALNEILVASGNAKLTSVDGVLFGHTKNIPTSLIYYPRGKAATTYKVPDTVTEIAAYAFAEQPYLEAVLLPTGLTKIQTYAFNKCEALRSIVIPKGVTTLGTYAFANCSSLESAAFEEGNSLTTIPDYLFQNAKALTSITLPANATKIGKYAFSTAALSSVMIPSSVKTIDNYAFGTNKNLTSVVFADGSKLTTLGTNVFYNCSALTSIEIPETVTSIGNYAFSGTGLRSFVLPPKVKSLSSNMFRQCADLTEVILHSAVTTINSSAFYGCSALETIEIPSSVATIGTNAFQLCESLKTIRLPNVTTISNYAFKDCASLETINVPNTVTTIGNYAFSGCSSLIEIVIPGAVISIGNYAFDGCTSLERVELMDGLESIGTKAFYDNQKLVAIEIPSTVMTIGDSAFVGCTGLKSLKVGVGSADFVVDNGILYNFDQSEIYFVTPATSGDIRIPDTVTDINPGAFSGSLIGSIRLPDSITVISDETFMDCSRLQSVIWSDELTKIGKRAFMNTPLDSITIGAKLTLVNESAFENCVRLSAVLFEDSTTRLSLANSAFKGCTALTEIHFPERLANTADSYSYIAAIGNSCFEGCTNLATVTFTEHVLSAFDYFRATIGNSAFRGCVALTSIELPSYVKNYTYGYSGTSIANPIGAYAFADCVQLSSFKFNVPDSETSYSMSGTATWDATTGEIKIASGSSFAFMNCISLKSIDLPAKAISLAPGMFYGSGLESITIGDAAAEKERSYTIGEKFFANCKSLKSVTINGQWRSLMTGTFKGCESLESVVVNEAEDSMTTIGSEAFYGCSKLTTFTLQSTLTAIHEGAFANCTSLVSVTIGEKVTTIGKYAFKGWTATQTILVPEFTEAPEKWEAEWNEGCNATVTWKQTTED